MCTCLRACAYVYVYRVSNALYRWVNRWSLFLSRHPLEIRLTVFLLIVFIYLFFFIFFIIHLSFFLFIYPLFFSHSFIIFLVYFIIICSRCIFFFLSLIEVNVTLREVFRFHWDHCHSLFINYFVKRSPKNYSLE